jgi:hypothetical protein
MKYIACIGWMAIAAAPAFAQPVEIPFDSVANPLKLLPDMYFGEVSGVAVNSKKHVFIFSRGNTTGPAYGAAAAQLLEFDGVTGKFVREIGRNLYAWSYAHAVRIDKDDNIWAIDKGSDMIIKFDPQGRVQMVFGRKKEASDEAAPWTRVTPPRPPVDGQFRQPTDVTWDTEGNIFISDGYINSRVAKFDKNGKWVKSFGTPGRENGQLNTPHSIAADAKGNIYVADRGNRRIQVFDPEGTYQRSITIDVPVAPGVQAWMGATPQGQGAGTMGSGAPWAICISPGPTQYLFSSDAYPGRIYKLALDGTVLGYFGTTGRQPKEFGWIHELACPSENEVWAAEILNWRVQKLVLHPAGATSHSGAAK